MLATAHLEPQSDEPTNAALAALRDLGRAAMTEGEDELAASCWHVARRLAPADPWAGHNQAVCLMRLGRLDEAERLYGEQLEMFPGFMASWRGRAQVAAGRGRAEEALAHFERALLLAPDHLETHLDAARQALMLSRFAQVRRRLAAAAALAPGDARLAALVEETLRRGGAAGWAGEAEPLLAAQDPACAEAWAARAQIAASAGRPEEAVRFWLRAAALKPGDPWPRNDLGHFAADRGELALAEAQFAMVLRRRPDFFHALRGLARVAKARGDLAAALAAFERAAEAEPGDGWMVCEIAALEASLGRPGAARRLDQLIARRPDFAPAYSARARLAADPAEALQWLESALARWPDDAWLGFEAARAERAAGQGGAAEARLRKLAGGGPAAAAARQELYHLLRERGDDAEAAELLRRCLAATPDDPGVLIAEAGRLAAEGRLDEAEAIYDGLAARELAPYWRRIGKGALARRRGFVAQARRWFEEAAEIDRREPAAYAELAALAQTPEEAEAVLARLEGWIAAAPGLYAARAQKARFLSQRGEPGAALAEWREIAALWPARAEAFVEMAREQERLGDGAAATASLARARSLEPDHPALLEAEARQAEWRDDIEGARDAMARALKAAPGRRWLRPQAARLNFLAGHADAAFGLLDAHPAEPEGEFQRVEMLRQTGRLDEALAVSQEARARFGGPFRLLWQGACLEADLGRFDAAARTMAQARPVNRFETSGLAFLKGYAAMAQWDFAAARGHLEAAVKDNPEDGWALNRLIHCHLMLFDVEAAREGLQGLARLNRAINQIKGKSTAWSQTHYGQLLDEFRLDADALAATAGAQGLADPEARLAALRRCVRAFPHYTPAAIAALIACRRAGLMNAGSPAAASAIPPRLTQFWDTPEPPADLAPYLTSWSRHNPGLACRRFDVVSAEAELGRLRAAGALQAFRRAEQPAMRADIFRLASLQAQGGGYADADDCCRASLAPLFQGGASLVVYQEDLGSIGNNFILSRPGHPAIGRALEDATRAVEDGAADLLWLSTGPGAITRALAAYLFEEEAGWRERLGGVRILDRPELLAHVAIHCHSSYKTSERHWSRTAFGRTKRRR